VLEENAQGITTKSRGAEPPSRDYQNLPVRRSISEFKSEAAPAGPPTGLIAFERVGERTVLRAARATSPLQLLMPRNHGHGAWVVLATLGGGLVDGDAIDLDVDVGPGAVGLLGTQASTKVYRCPNGTCRQGLDARVAAGAVLVVVPDPVACFAGARYEQSVRVDLDPTASLVLVDAFTAGRVGRGESWDFLRYGSRTTVTRRGAVVLADAIVLDPAQGDLRARMGRFAAFATVVVFGPAVTALQNTALAVALPGRGAPVVTAASPIGDDGAVVRVAGTSVETVSTAVRRCLSGLAAVLGDDPFARKW
jgi:urease accessory protein